MTDKVMAWTLAALSIVFGLGFILNTNLIPSLPVMFHWIFGALFLVLGGNIAYKAS